MTTQPSGCHGRSGTNRPRVLGAVAALIILDAAWCYLAGKENGEEVARSSLAAAIGCRSNRAAHPRLEDWRAEVRTLAAMVRYLSEPEPPPMEVSAPRDERPH